jgi:hypothetical protein
MIMSKKIEESDDILKGALAICKYMKNISLATLMDRIHTMGLPAVKLPGETIWTSSKKAIDEWLEEMIQKMKEANAPKWVEPSPEEKKRQKRKEKKLKF